MNYLQRKGYILSENDKTMRIVFARRKGILFLKTPQSGLRPDSSPFRGAENKKNLSAFLLGGLILSASASLLRDCVVVLRRSYLSLASPERKFPCQGKCLRSRQKGSRFRRKRWHPKGDGEVLRIAHCELYQPFAPFVPPPSFTP